MRAVSSEDALAKPADAMVAVMEAVLVSELTELVNVQLIDGVPMGKELNVGVAMPYAFIAAGAVDAEPEVQVTYPSGTDEPETVICALTVIGVPDGATRGDTDRYACGGPLCTVKLPDIVPLLAVELGSPKYFAVMV